MALPQNPNGRSATMTIVLSTIGSRGVTIDIGPAAVAEAAGGIALACGLHDGPLIFTLSAEEAHQLYTAIGSQLKCAQRPNHPITPARKATGQHDCSVR
jgi:hypothetical protein